MTSNNIVLKLKSIGFSESNLNVDHLCVGNNNIKKQELPISPDNNNNSNNNKVPTQQQACNNNNHSNLSTLKTVENFFNHHDFSAFLSFNEFYHHHHSSNNNQEKENNDDFCTNLNKLKSSIVSSILPQLSEHADLLKNSTTNLSSQQQQQQQQQVEKPNNDEIFKKDEPLSTLLIYFISDILIHQPIGEPLLLISKSFKKFFNISDKLFHHFYKKALSLTKYYLLEINKNKEYYNKLQDNLENDEFRGDKILMEKIKSYQLEQIEKLEKKNKEIRYFNYLNTVWIKVYCATGLQIADLISSDPYVNLFFTDSQDEKPHHQRESLNTIHLNDHSKSQHHHFKTTVKKKTLQPIWNEEFIMSTDKPDQNILIASVYDFDQVSSSDFLGFIPIHLNEDEEQHNQDNHEHHEHHEHLNFQSIDEVVTIYELLSKPKGKLTKFKSLLGIKTNTKVMEDNESRKFGSIKLGIINLKREILNVEDININNQNLPSKQIDIQMNQNHENSISSLFDYLLNQDKNFNLPKEIDTLLKSFSKRVLISPISINLIMLEKLVIGDTTGCFEISTSCMDEILKLLQETIHQITIEKIPISKTIQDRFLKVIKSIKKQYKELIKKYPISFPITINKDTKLPDNLGSSGTLLTITIETLELIYKYENKKEAYLIEKLKELVINYIEFCWLIVIEKSLLSIEDSTSFENIVQLLQVYESIELQLIMDIEMYSKFFPPQFNLSQLSSTQYYLKLKNETEIQLLKESKVCMETFNLLKLIQKIEKLIKPYVVKVEGQVALVPFMDLNQLFSKFIKMWMIEIKKQFNCWISRSLEKEDWKSVDSKNNLLHSNSLIDLFTIFEIGKNHLLGIDLNIDQYIFQFIEIINQIYNQYLETISNSILQDLKNDKSNPLFFDEINDYLKLNLKKLILKIKDTQESNQQQQTTTTISNSNRIINSIICIKLNSLEFSRQLLFDFSSDLELKLPHLKEKIQDSFGISFINSKKKYDYIIDLVINNISKWIKVLIHEILDNNNNNKLFSNGNSSGTVGGVGKPIILNEIQINEILESLFLLLNNELSILSGNLYYPTFSKFIKGVWQSIWVEFNKIIFPENKLQSDKYQLVSNKCSIILSIYPFLEEFFNANGTGISIDQLRLHSEYLLSTISVYFTNFKNLLEIYNHLSSVGFSNSKFNYNLIYSNLFNLNQLKEFSEFKFKNLNYIKELHILSSISSHVIDSTNGNHDEEIEQFKSLISNITNSGGFKNRFILDKFSLDSNFTNFKIDFNCKTKFGILTNAYLMNDCICWSSWLCFNESKEIIKYSNIKSIIRQQHDNNDILIIINCKEDDKQHQIWSITNSNQDQVFNCLVSSSKLINNSISIMDYIKTSNIHNVGDNSNFIIPTTTTTASPTPSSISVNLKNGDNENNNSQQQNQQSLERESHVSYDDNITYHTLYHLDKDNIIYDIYPCFSGKIITTRDYFCHFNSITKSNKHILWSEIIEIKKESVLFFQTGIKLTFKNGESTSFSGINNRDKLHSELLELRDLNKSNASPILRK